jgi:hypothetical protein
MERCVIFWIGVEVVGGVVGGVKGACLIRAVGGLPGMASTTPEEEFSHNLLQNLSYLFSRESFWDVVEPSGFSSR